MPLEYIPSAAYISSISANLVNRAQQEILSSSPFASRIHHSVYFPPEDMKIHADRDSYGLPDEFWDRSFVFYLLVLESESAPIL